jgi:diguanylate cyclase (GGDEF)-like protein
MGRQVSFQIATRGDVLRHTGKRAAIAAALTIVMTATTLLLHFGTDLQATVTVGYLLGFSLCIATLISAALAGAMSYRSALLMRELTLTRGELARISQTDELTGLFNRRGFDEAGLLALTAARKLGVPVAVFLCDIDHFKSINDRYGRAVGDEAIKFVALACKQDLRGSDMVGRVGGEEFALVLPETDRAQAAIVAERIRERVAAQFLSAHKVQFKTSISVGVAEATASMSGVDALLRAADLALYQAKESGRNRVVERSEPTPPKLAAE